MTVLELLSSKEKFTQGSWAKDANGSDVSANDPTAFCFCLKGAIFRCYGHHAKKHQEYCDKLYALGIIPEHMSIINWSDTHSYEEVIDLVRKAGI